MEMEGFVDGSVMDIEPQLDDDDEMMENYEGELIAYDGDSNFEPCVGMEFESEESAKAHYNSYARLMGFSTRVSGNRRSKRDGSIIRRGFVCAKEGFRIRKEDVNGEGRVRRPREDTRVGCKAMVMIRKQDSGKWVVTKFVKEHNHELVAPDKVHCLRSHRHISGTAKSLIDNMLGAGIGPSGIMSVLIKESGGISNVGFTERDCRNYVRLLRQKSFGGDIQHVLDYLKHTQAENPAFFCAVQVDEHQGMGNVFWADARSRMAYNYFGDAVTFDLTYKANRYRMPFATFMGVNHHRQPVLFGCAILLEQSESSFAWLFRTWLAAMSGRHPISITTDPDRALRTAVAQVFPQTRHRFCKWHILREVQEKLSNVFRMHPTFQGELHKCINSTETIDEFESCWVSLLDRYDLRENEWFHSLYSARRQWVPVYLRDTFFAETYATQQNESINTFFDGYVNAQTSPQVFGSQYEKALDSRYEKEVKADLDTINTTPSFKTPSPMEKQAASLYTKKTFSEFQDELIDTLVYTANKIEEDGAISTYRVAKFGTGNKSYNVTFNVFEMRANCSCQMFEHSGILCRHVLTVFKVRNVLTLPSHYILKRWTRNAKSWLVSDERGVELQGDCKEALALRYNNLRHEAIKYAEDGASGDIYSVAMSALQHAANRVAAAKKKVSRSAQLGALLSGSNLEGHISEGSQVDNLMTSQTTLNDPHQFLLWGSLQSQTLDEDKEIQELTYLLERANRRREALRTHFLLFLQDIGEHEQNLSKKESDLPDGFPFEIVDNPGEQTITLKREFAGESIQVEVHMPDLTGGGGEEDNDDDDDDRDEDKEDSGRLNVSLIVTVEKGEGPCLEFSVTAYPDEITIDSLLMKGKPVSEDQLAYEGPEFSDLDENLQKAFCKYLEDRGIKSSLTNFLQEYMIKKDSREYLDWLKSMKSFIATFDFRRQWRVLKPISF